MIPVKWHLHIALVMVAVALLFYCCSHTNGPLPPKPMLPVNDKEQLIIDPVRHRLIVLKTGSTKTITLPDRPSIIDFRRDGTVAITARQFGFERRLFIGLQGDSAARLVLGLDGYYFKKLDLGMGFGSEVGTFAPVLFVKASYNIYSNLQFGLTYTNQGRVGVALTVRL